MKFEIIDEEPPVIAAHPDDHNSIHPNIEDAQNEQVEDPEYNQTQLAKMFGMSRNMVIDLLNEHEIEHVNQGQGGPKGKKYRLSQVRDILKHTNLKSDRKLAATERKLEAEAELKEIEVKRKLGEMIETSDVELGAVQLFRALHNRLVQYCDESALDLVRLKTRGEVAFYQKEHIGKLLQDLRADPNNFVTRYMNANTQTD